MIELSPMPETLPEVKRLNLSEGLNKMIAELEQFSNTQESNFAENNLKLSRAIATLINDANELPEGQDENPLWQRAIALKNQLKGSIKPVVDEARQ